MQQLFENLHAGMPGVTKSSRFLKIKKSNHFLTAIFFPVTAHVSVMSCMHLSVTFNLPQTVPAPPRDPHFSCPRTYATPLCGAMCDLSNPTFTCDCRSLRSFTEANIILLFYFVRALRMHQICNALCRVPFADCCTRDADALSSAGHDTHFLHLSSPHWTIAIHSGALVIATQRLNVVHRYCTLVSFCGSSRIQFCLSAHADVLCCSFQ
jgi:hypothetical protein